MRRKLLKIFQQLFLFYLTGGDEKRIQILVWNIEGKRQLGRSKCRWEDISKWIPEK
jgi:hypothetical protein